jgi:VanZ family protein
MILPVRLVAWLTAAAVIALTFVPPWWRPVSGLPHAVEHVAIFFLLGGTFALGYRGHAWSIGLVAILFAAALEMLQMLIPGRHARLSDFVVNALGICAGIAAASLVERVRSSRRA